MASLRIFQDQENVVQTGLPKRPLRENKAQNAPLQQKRAVLGIITSNKIQTRAQTQKTAKLESKPSGLCVANAAKGIQKSTLQVVQQLKVKESFLIHEDNAVDQEVFDAKLKNENKLTTKSEQPLSSTITGLLRPPLHELGLENTRDDDTESCLSLGAAVQNCSILSTIDDEEERDTQPAILTVAHLIACEEYKDDIYDYLLEAEGRHQPKPYYMKKQPDISYSMRAILVDWLVEVAGEYNLQNETLYLAVSFLDRFLSLMSVVRNKLQLVGTAAMFIAAKYEEIYPPDVGEFVYITDDTYTKRQVLRMEHLILKVLGFDISVPTTLSFIVSFCSATKASDHVQYLSMYLSELSLMVGDPFFDFVPSVRAAASIALARHMLFESPAWPQELENLSFYALGDLKPCMRELNSLLEAAPTHAQQAIRDKYKSSSKRAVSTIVPRSITNLL